ncbi:protein IWS1 homolog isoform X2 [Electrophorus electricus]|uniref:protein IWS1 homolog isoform X2 n=1 Tax=Electrophorus electricus TaxID=8005 RepID=UPI0015D0A2D5|nr:protein IWS1 homolog isoform X2 [Electrophorus electricus]XP_026866841.2 protein IWS1 homolog isoform X2 [Electrophorus electricus]
MDGGDEFFSGNHSDDGSGTPVQDENAVGSDLEEEEMRGESRQSEDEGSDRESVAGSLVPPGGGSGSEHEDGRGRQVSDSEPEAPHHADSEDDGEDSPTKCRGSPSEREEQPTARASESDCEDPRRGESPRSDSNSDSESDGEKSRQRTRGESEGEDGDEGRKDGEAGECDAKAAVHSDSEEEERKPKEEADSEQDEMHTQRTIADSDDEEKPVKRKAAILSDSEDEGEMKATKRRRAVSDDDESASEEGSEAPDKTVAAKLRELGSDSEEEEESRMETDAGKKDEKTLFGSDSDSENNEEEKMIADIFGESGDEEEFTGFNQEELEGENQQSHAAGQKVTADDSDSDDIERGGRDMMFMSDFDMMLARRKAQSGKRRRHRDGGTFISDADDVVSAMITKMTEAAEEDRTLNSQKKPALKKLMLLPTVVMHLKKQDLKETFIDSGVMTAIKEWISPLPDKSLPALKIREELLKILQELPSVSQETLKMSGIGRAVMYLYKHPKESRPNKDLALKLINEWSRPIFGLSSNYKGMTREERQQRDLDQQIAPRRRLSEPQKVERAEETDVFGPHLSSGGQTPRRDLEKVLTGEEKALRPGDPGFCARARVPMPSNKDYVVRPKWNVETDSNRRVKRGISRLEKHKRRFAEQRKQRRPQGAVKISVEGNRMPL